uniref:NADH-ubiquinone oxidoreductase chain 1 n=1 Tax=Lovenula raynerae TaxID=2487506 RepID=A0A3G4YLH3_9MAXI|nr:NADH dehydrogenase subunit 1 [Lovenula raynerae]
MMCSSFLILILAILVNVAFITLLERKILGYSQLRKGPNKVGMAGILQPFNDAIKLFSKESFTPLTSNMSMFLLSPMLAISFSLIIFMSFPLDEKFLSQSISILMIYMILSLNVYPTLLSGWSSNSKYAMVGSLRAIAQTISYEVSLALIFLFFISLSKFLDLSFLAYQNYFWSKLIMFLPLTLMWLISCMAETNRTPFDFAEGESELVSGFNIEYGSVGFALIFMAEYASIFFMCVLFSFFFMSPSSYFLLTYVIATSLVFFWVWVRTTFPRYRYDLLMNLAWKVYLPMTLFMFMFILSELV